MHVGKSKLQICKKCRNIKNWTEHEMERSYVDDGCEQGIFQLKYQEPHKRWSTHFWYFSSFGWSDGVNVWRTFVCVLELSFFFIRFLVFFHSIFDEMNSNDSIEAMKSIEMLYFFRFVLFFSALFFSKGKNWWI